MTTRKTRKVAKKTRKQKFYGKDRYIPYAIHKTTIISFDPITSCKQMKYIFGSALSKIQAPPDKALKKRGIRWVRFINGGKGEFHFVPPFRLTDDRELRKIEEKQENISPLESQFFENHVGIYVPDLTDIIIRCLKRNIKCHLNRRGDGMYQFYIEIDGAIDYLDVDSISVDFDKIHKVNRFFHAYDFKKNSLVQELLQKEYMNKKNHSIKSRIYLDPNHDMAPRKLEMKENGNITVKGIDKTNGKLWQASGTLHKNNRVVLDFSCKGGPKNIRGQITKTGLKFEDGNIWNSL